MGSGVGKSSLYLVGFVVCALFDTHNFSEVSWAFSSLLLWFLLLTQHSRSFISNLHLFLVVRFVVCTVRILSICTGRWFVKSISSGARPVGGYVLVITL